MRYPVQRPNNGHEWRRLITHCTISLCSYTCTPHHSGAIACRVSFSPSHRLTVSPSHRLTVSPSHRLTVSPSHRLTVSPSHRLTISPSHHLTISPSVCLCKCMRIAAVMGKRERLRYPTLSARRRKKEEWSSLRRSRRTGHHPQKSSSTQANQDPHSGCWWARATWTNSRGTTDSRPRLMVRARARGLLLSKGKTNVVSKRINSTVDWMGRRRCCFSAEAGHTSVAGGAFFEANDITRATGFSIHGDNGGSLQQGSGSP